MKLTTENVGEYSKRKAPSDRLDDKILGKVLREQVAHVRGDVLDNSYKLKNRFKHIWTYPSRVMFDQTLLIHLSGLNQKCVLDYGCGRGGMSLHVLAQGGEVYGIDISPVYIKDAITQCISAGYDYSRFHFSVMDAHQIDFPDSTFDIVVGMGILHHLDWPVALDEVHRVLKPGGRVLFQEPLADNPLLKIFRRFTTFARTVDERPFTKKDLKKIEESHKWESEMSFCGVLEAPAAMITSFIMPSYPNNIILKVVDKFEQMIHNAHVLDSWNQYVLINLIKRGQ